MSDLKVLQIETTNLCNSHCVFCVHDQFKKFGTMEERLFKKILNDAKEIETLEKIIPMLTGEPFLDPNMIKYLKLINEILPDKKIELYTNGSFLTITLVEELSKIRNLVMYFSINGACKETRKKLMGLDNYDHVVEMVRLYEKTGKPFNVTFVCHPDVDREEFIEFKKLWKGHARLIRYANFAGKKYQTRKPIINCSRAIEHMTVLFDGRVNLCCFDPFGEFIFGDLNESSIKRIWNSEKRQIYARCHFVSMGYRLKPCDKCFN